MRKGIMMQENQNKEKLQGGEIHFPARERKERAHGRVYKWFDNFWYHHKWKTIISLVLAVIVLVCTLQMCQRESKGDISVVVAGPYNFTVEEGAFTELRNCLSRSSFLKDYDEDGISRADIQYFPIYSEAQIKEMREHMNDEGDPEPIEVNTLYNAQNYNKYNQYMMTGETSVLLLDPWLFEEMAAKGEYLVDLSLLYGKAPEGAVYYTDSEGKDHLFGVRLGDIPLYQNLAMQVLSPDTVLCLMGPYFMGNSADEAVYDRSVAYFAALAGIR